MKKILTNTKQFIRKCKRVWHVLKKPTKKEFWGVAKISAIGIAILGLLGFALSIIIKGFFWAFGSP